MITVLNNLDTSLVIPGGLNEKAALVLLPKTQAKIEKVTSPLKDAEKKGLIKISYPKKKKAISKEVNKETDKEIKKGQLKLDGNK